MVVLVTGSAGQLGQSLYFLAGNYSEINFVFCSSKELDISDFANCETIFNTIKPSYCINAAAYTAVDKAETEPEKAKLINVIGAKNLAEVCKKHHSVLIHISTDFVFDGEKTSPYTEEDSTHPIGVYGKTKLEGEQVIQSILKEHFIIRTSWLYSQFGNNFMKTMLRLASERDSLSIVNDQIGTPTNAVDLAKAIITIALANNENKVHDKFGIYHFSSEGSCSWFDFAKKIFEVNKIAINLNPIPTTSFPTPAKRPKYSVLDKTKIKNNFGLTIKKWEDSLEPFPSL
jgi:dTDP-4-dehydrorhamnose reductase